MSGSLTWACATNSGDGANSRSSLSSASIWAVVLSSAMTDPLYRQGMQRGKGQVANRQGMVYVPFLKMSPRRSLFLLVALSFWPAACTPRSGPVSAPPNIVLVTIDTLRADRVGRGLTPAIDGLAARGMRFTSA